MGFNYAIADAANLRLKEKSTGNIVLSTPYANTTTAEFSSEQVYANAKGSRAVRFDYNKQGKLTCEFEVFDLKWISILLGGAWSTGVVDIAQKDVLSASATNTITLTGTPNASSLAIFKLQADNIGHDAEQTVGTPGTTPNTYSISGTTVTLNATTAPEGTKFVCYYLKDSAATAETLNIKSTEFPVSYEVIGDTMMARKYDGVTEFVQFKCPNAKPLGNITITMQASGVTNISAVFDLFPNEDNDMMILTKL